MTPPAPPQTTPPRADPPQTAPPPRTTPPGIPRWVPAVVVAVGVLALALTARSSGSFTPIPAHGLLKAFRPPVAIAAGLLLVGVASLYAPHRVDSPISLLDRAGRACAVLIGTAAVVTPLALLFLGHGGSARVTAPPEETPTVTPTGPVRTLKSSLPPDPNANQTRRGWFDNLPIGQAIAVVLVVGTLAIIAFVVYSLIQAQRRIKNVPAPTSDLPFGMLEDADELADAVDAAVAALAAGGAAREAVIACYAAMEERVALAGVTRNRSDSPDEWLKRAAAAGLIRGTAGQRLTDLFREARFSRHPISDDQRNAARDALQEIAADLRILMTAIAERQAAEARAAAEAQARLQAQTQAQSQSKARGTTS